MPWPATKLTVQADLSTNMQAFAALPAPPDDEAAVHAALLKIAAAQLLFVPPAVTVHVLRIELSTNIQALAAL